MKYLRISVFKDPYDCTLGGISSTNDHIYIECDEGPIRDQDIENKELIFYTEQRGLNYWAAKQRYPPNNEMGAMSGGNLAYCCDSRCKHVYHIHDRFETAEQYRALSI